MPAVATRSIVSVLITLSLALAAGNAYAVQNNNPTGGAKKPDACDLRYRACIGRCLKWYGTTAESNSCEERTCFPQYVACINTPQ